MKPTKEQIKEFWEWSNEGGSKMPKQLTGLEELTQKANLDYIIYYANNIVELARQLKQDDTYINEDHLLCLVDNAQCMIDLLGTIALRRDYEEAERVIKTFAGEEWWRFLKSKYLEGGEEEGTFDLEMEEG